MKKELVQEYINWLSHDILTLNSAKSDVFTTPFLNPFNDCNQVSISFTKDKKIRISDDADTSFNISKTFGINLKRSPSKSAQMQSLLEMYLMKFEGDEIVRYCDESTFPWALHYFSIGIMSIQNQFSNIKYNVQYDISYSSIQVAQKRKLINYVEEGFVHRKIDFRREVQKFGRSGFKHKYDFSFGADEAEPSILMKAPNALRPDNTQLMLFEWGDYLNTLSSSDKPTLFVVANDIEQRVDKKIEKLIVNTDDVLYCPISEESVWMEECRKMA